MQQVCWCVPYTNRNVTGTTPKIHFEILTVAFASRPQACGHVEIDYIPKTPNQYCPATKFPQDNGGWSTRNFRFYKAFGSFKHLWGVIRGSFQVITDRCMNFFGTLHKKQCMFGGSNGTRMIPLIGAFFVLMIFYPASIESIWGGTNQLQWLLIYFAKNFTKCTNSKVDLVWLVNWSTNKWC